MFKVIKFYQQKSHYCTRKLIKELDINKLRNIGIFAHIDAGKTTTTERMLYYSGTIKHMGEVHHGNTVTDYMPQERDRGITIKSAAVVFPWRGHQFNLIDTPGHIDFTMEVEQTLHVLDGAIVVLDGSAGVEAQTLTVWRQADRYNIPRIVFVNKMDRIDADFTLSCRSIEEKFDKLALPLQLPIKVDNKLIGIVDVLTLQKHVWDSKNQMVTKPLVNTDGVLFENAKQARNVLIDKLSELDDSLANVIIETESLESVKTVDVVKALRGVIHDQKAVGVLCGSAYKNIGIEPLMDSIILYLPTPIESNKMFSVFGEQLVARAFKILHDKQRGPLVFFRIYSGKMNKNQRMYNVQQDINEQGNKLLVAYADDYEEVDSLTNGNIAVVTGLKKTVTGNLFTASASLAQKALQKSPKVFEQEAKIPEPVFFCSIEPQSLAYQAGLEQALDELRREDPSLRVTHDTETGQTVLAGMGELHLEIIRDRLLKEYKLEADLGPLQISYREAPVKKMTHNHTTETKIGNNKQFVQLQLTLVPSDRKENKDILRLDRSSEMASELASVPPRFINAVRQGVDVGLNHGTKVGSKVINTYVILHMLTVGRGTSETVVTATATQCIQKLLAESGTQILEPIMQLEIITPDEYLSTVLADLSKRRAVIQNVTLRANNKMVLTETPLSDLMGYSTTLRTITSGTGTFSMEFLEYKIMSQLDEVKAIEAVRGF